ncbi:MAG: glycosyltransferase family 39 protein [Candidatus Acidiferrales bacterium]
MSETGVLDVASRPLDRAVSRHTALSAAAMLAGLAAAKLLIQFAGIHRYGFFRDELYYMACGEHLAWGYVDQPPLIAVAAWLARHIFGTSIAALRLLPALCGAAIVYLTGRFARELGGGRFAQVLAAAAILLAPAYLAFDSFFSMNAFEPLFWLLCAWMALRVVKGASPRLWLAFGAIAGVGLQNKHTMLVFGFALAVGLLLSGEAKLFRTKWIWLGGLVAIAIFLPNLIWEARHGWPQIEVVRNAQLFKNTHIGPLRFVTDQALFLNPFALPLWLGGLAWYFFLSEGKRFRFLGWSYLIVLAVFIAFDGKSYYALPAYPLLLAAGAVAFEKFTGSLQRRSLRIAYTAALVISAIGTLPFGVPVLSVDAFLKYSHAIPYASLVKTERDATVQLPQLYADMFGWDAIATTVADVYHGLPQSERAGCAILAGNYGEAGAIDYYGPALGLPKAISGHNSYYDWGPRGYSGSCAIIFGERSGEFIKYFGEVQRVTIVPNPYGMPSERNVAIYVCHKPVAPLADLWPRFKLII